MKRTSKRETAAKALPYADAVRLQLACGKCGARPGEKCKDYRGRGKALCPTRGLDVPAAPPLADPPTEQDLDRPVKQPLWWEALPREEREVPR